MRSREELYLGQVVPNLKGASLMDTGFVTTQAQVVDSQVTYVRVRDWLLSALTVSSGAVDAISFLALGKIFTAFMTGNIAFLGMGIAGHPGAPFHGRGGEDVYARLLDRRDDLRVAPDCAIQPAAHGRRGLQLKAVQPNDGKAALNEALKPGPTRGRRLMIARTTAPRAPWVSECATPVLFHRKTRLRLQFARNLVGQLRPAGGEFARPAVTRGR